MGLYLLRRPISVQKLAGFRPAERERHSAKLINAGEVVESVSSANKEGRIIVRHAGDCYRMWKEELQDIHIAERVDTAIRPVVGSNGR